MRSQAAGGWFDGFETSLEDVDGQGEIMAVELAAERSR
jgi:hypothetical protein